MQVRAPAVVWVPGPFVKVSCPAIPAALVDDEFFGYEG